MQNPAVMRRPRPKHRGSIEPARRLWWPPQRRRARPDQPLREAPPIVRCPRPAELRRRTCAGDWRPDVERRARTGGDAGRQRCFRHTAAVAPAIRRRSDRRPAAPTPAPACRRHRSDRARGPDALAGAVSPAAAPNARSTCAIRSVVVTRGGGAGATHGRRQRTERHAAAVAGALGPVEVHIDLRSSQINVNFVAAHPETRSALEQSVPTLRRAGARWIDARPDAGAGRSETGSQSQPRRAAAVRRGGREGRR